MILSSRLVVSMMTRSGLAERIDSTLGSWRVPTSAVSSGSFSAVSQVVKPCRIRHCSRIDAQGEQVLGVLPFE